MGYYVYMDENGDAEGNYSLVSLCKVDLWRENNRDQNLAHDISNDNKNGLLGWPKQYIAKIIFKIYC